jgi:hypothetical protein
MPNSEERVIRRSGFRSMAVTKESTAGQAFQDTIGSQI